MRRNLQFPALFFRVSSVSRFGGMEGIAYVVQNHSVINVIYKQLCQDLNDRWLRADADINVKLKRRSFSCGELISTQITISINISWPSLAIFNQWSCFFKPPKVNILFIRLHKQHLIKIIKNVSICCYNLLQLNMWRFSGY